MRAALLVSAVVATLAVLVVPSPAAAEPYCDRIPVPPACNEDPGPPGSHNPTGTLATVSRQPAGIAVTGDAKDPDSNNPVTVEIKIDGVLTGTVVATGGRYSGTVPARSGAQVCATARSIGAGANAVIGCRGFTVAVDPFGAWDGFSREGDYLRVRGWALDPDTATSIYLDARDENGAHVGTVSAHAQRPDIGALHPGYGDYHGFDALLPENPADGSHQICLRLINILAGGHVELGCRGYAVRHLPYGGFDTLERDGGTLRVGGWALDPDDTGAQLAVRVNVDGTIVHEGTARVARTGGGWGFDLTGVPAGTDEGSHGVCVSAKNVGAGTQLWTEIDCRGYYMPGQVKAPVVRPLVKNDTLLWLRNQLRWTNDEGVEGVRVERSVADGPWQEVYRVDGKVDAYNDTDVRAGTRYCYRVVTTNTRPSTASAEVCGNSLLPAPQAPTGARVATTDDTSVTVTWFDNATTEDGYRLEVTGGGTSKVLELPAMPGGWRQETITGLRGVTGYTILIKPVQNNAADLPDDLAGKAEGWTTGVPRIDAFTANPGTVQACVPVGIQLAWKVAGATHISITRDGAPVYGDSRDTPGQWDGQTGGGSNDGGVRYVLTASNYFGQSATKTVTVQRQAPQLVRLIKRIALTNVSLEPMRVYHIDALGRETQLLDELLPGETYIYTPPNCQKVRMVVKTKLDGKVRYDTFDIMGHAAGADLSARVSNPSS